MTVFKKHPLLEKKKGRGNFGNERLALIVSGRFYFMLNNCLACKLCGANLQQCLLKMY